MVLTYKQQAFVEHYLGGARWNASEAARRAGYKHPGPQGSRLLKNVKIRARIIGRLAEMGATTEALMARWLQRIGVDISPFVTGRGLNVQELKEAGLGFLIKGVRKTAHATNIELRDPDKAEEMLAKHLGMFVERREHSGEVTAIVKTVGGGVAEEL